MNIYSVPAVIAFVLNITIAFIIFFGNPRSAVNRWISALVLSFALWNISEIFILASSNQEGATLAAQLLYRIIFIIPSMYVLSAYYFPRNVSDLHGGTILVIAVFALPITLLILSFPNFNIQLVSLSDSRIIYFYRIVIKQDFQSLSLLATYFGYLLWGTVVMAMKIPKLRTTTKKRRARLFLSGGLAFIALSVFLFLVQRFSVEELDFYASSTTLSFVVSLFLAAAVFKGKLFGSSQAARSGLAYTIASSIILTIYFLGIQAATRGLRGFLGTNSYLVNVILVLLLVALIHPLEMRIRKTLDHLLSRDLNRYRHSMVRFSRAISSYLPPNEFFRRVEVFLLRQFHIQNVFVFLKETGPEGPRFSEWKSRTGGLNLEDDCIVIRYLRKEKRAVEFYDIDRRLINGEACSVLEASGVRIFLPMFSADELIGVLAISVQKSGQEFSADMIEALTILANEVATAHQRNLAIESIHRKEQEEFRVRHLASLGQLIAGVAHEIRNPLNVISASAQTLLKKQLNKNEEEELKEFIVDEAERLNKILTDFLNLSKLKTPENQEVSIQEILEKVRAAIISTAGDIDVRISRNTVAHTISTDRDLLYQLVFNLATNAIEAVKERCKADRNFDCSEGEVSLTAILREEGLEISVSDNGIGIGEDNQEKVFEPFYTTKETGTGLGLSISHNIAEALGAQIRVTPGKGETIFTVRFETTKEYA